MLGEKDGKFRDHWIKIATAMGIVILGASLGIGALLPKADCADGSRGDREMRWCIENDVLIIFDQYGEMKIPMTGFDHAAPMQVNELTVRYLLYSNDFMKYQIVLENRITRDRHIEETHHF
ncbi:MAG TPA: hypothetical protein VLH19_05720 [Patescibacteria group bacterium]|nr:hypothetical protein [Patescibacteria group bacterium]